jgi:3-phenylpropionate/cinnamic acid dioxygenase small subunit
LVQEAYIFDAQNYEDWLDLLTDDIHYIVPVRVTPAMAAGYGSSPLMAHFDENKYSLSRRVARFLTEHAWTEDRPSRMRHYVTNVRTFATVEPDEIVVDSAVLLYRSRGESITIGNEFAQIRVSLVETRNGAAGRVAEVRSAGGLVPTRGRGPDLGEPSNVPRCDRQPLRTAPRPRIGGAVTGLAFGGPDVHVCVELICTAARAIRTVAAHLVAATTPSKLPFVGELVRHRGDAHATNDAIARRIAAGPAGELATRLRRYADSQFAPPLVGARGPLTDVLVHGADMRLPLGLPHTPDPAHVRPALEFVTTGRPVGFVPRGRLRGRLPPPNPA